MRNGRRMDARRSSTGNAIMGLSLSLALSLCLCLSLSLVRIYCTWLWNHITRRLILQARRRYGLSFADFVRRDGKSS